MSFKLGLVGLCTSHPENWVPIIRELSDKENLDIEINCVWDSKETRPDGFAKEFAEKFKIPLVLENLNDMVDKVDGIILHSTNWDKHIEQANEFVKLDKSVLIDKPVVGKLHDANIVLDWIKSGKRITGGSSLRFTREVQEFLSKPITERGEVHCAYSAIGVDDFNYGIHAYAMASCLMGKGIVSAKYISSSKQKHIQLKWRNANIVILTIGKSEWLPFNLTVVTSKNVEYIQADTGLIYKSLLEKELPYLCGKSDKNPLDIDEFLEPELAAIAARRSWMNNGQEIFLTDLKCNDSGYDGRQFAIEYRRSRI